MTSPSQILDALRRVKEKDGETDVVSAGRISGVTVRGGKAGFVITLRPGEQGGALQAACERAAGAVPGIASVTAVLTAEAGEAATAPARKAEWNAARIPQVKRVIAVASGKGGVGKSTTAVNLAHAFAARGLRVGLLDADIHGPSLPRMLGLSGQPRTDAGMLLPLEAHGIACMSLGFMTPEGSAIVWRGPQVSRALQQMLRGTRWGTEQQPLDMLLIDMPPGTGDIHLSLVQQAPVDGALLVTTPQDVALADARKCLDMFRKLHVPVLGVVENMHGFRDPSGALHAIFGEGGGQKLADEAGAKLLGQIPIDMQLREASDSGARFSDPQGLYRAIAAAL